MRRASAAGVLLAVVAALVAAGGAGAKARACGTVTINEQAWAGSTANTYVVKNVLEKNLGCKVNITKITEVPVYQAMADGKTDAILEDWGHIPQQKQYVTKQHTVVYAGKNGVTVEGPSRAVMPAASSPEHFHANVERSGQGERCRTNRLSHIGGQCTAIHAHISEGQRCRAGSGAGDRQPACVGYESQVDRALDSGGDA